jgi:hypothetical protein
MLILSVQLEINFNFIKKNGCGKLENLVLADHKAADFLRTLCKITIQIFIM